MANLLPVKLLCLFLRASYLILPVSESPEGSVGLMEGVSEEEYQGTPNAVCPLFLLSRYCLKLFI